MLSRLAEGVRVRLVQASPAKIARFDAPARLATLSFDDWPRSAWTVAGPVLASRGVRATYFTSGGFCGRRIGDLDYFTRDDLLAVREDGHEIACHTFTHADLSGLPARAIQAEFERNAAFLRDAVGEISVASFAYPFGQVSLAAKRVVAARFASGRGIREAMNRGRVDLAQLSAFGLERYRGSQDPGAWLRRAVEEGGWLHVFTHDVSPAPSPYGCAPDDLARFVDAALEAGLRFVTQDEGARMMSA